MEDNVDFVRVSLDDGALSEIEAAENMPLQSVTAIMTLIQVDRVLKKLVEKFSGDSFMSEIITSQDVSYGVLLDLMRG
jgi:hypothetical protein